jgi:hypothetical protein
LTLTQGQAGSWLHGKTAVNPDKETTMSQTNETTACRCGCACTDCRCSPCHCGACGCRACACGEKAK